MDGVWTAMDESLWPLLDEAVATPTSLRSRSHKRKRDVSISSEDTDLHDARLRQAVKKVIMSHRPACFKQPLVLN